jgi:predicted patatin/cPLA2 family phospholipase
MQIAKMAKPVRKWPFVWKPKMGHQKAVHSQSAMPQEHAQRMALVHLVGHANGQNVALLKRPPQQADARGCLHKARGQEQAFFCSLRCWESTASPEKDHDTSRNTQSILRACSSLPFATKEF